MHTEQLAVSAYRDTTRAIGPTQNTELAVIEEVTKRLRRASNQPNKNFSVLASAIALNRKMWIAFAVDVAEPTNPLPSTLRAQIFYLAEFVEHQSRLILTENESIEPLLDINQLIISGLSAQSDHP